MSANKALRRLLKRIDQLKGKIEDLEIYNEELQSDVDAAHYRVESVRRESNRQAERLDYQLRQARDDADYRNYEVEKISRQIERAKDYNDDYEVDRLTRKLRAL